MPKGRYNPVSYGATWHGTFGDSPESNPGHGANAYCTYCRATNCLIYRYGDFLCRNAEDCQKRLRAYRIPRKRPEDSGWVPDGVVREEDLFRDPALYEEYCARRRGMTVEAYREYRRKRDEAWEDEQTWNRKRRRKRAENDDVRALSFDEALAEIRRA